MKIEAMLWILVFILVALAFLYPKTRGFSLSAIGVAIIDSLQHHISGCGPPLV